MKRRFRSISTKVSILAGSPFVFIIALLIVVLWAMSGPAANYSDTWQLIINTGTTIVTFLMVFLIQNTQNRDNNAVHLKLDELIRSNRQARASFMSLEDISDEELEELAAEFRKLHDQAQPSTSLHKLHKKIEAEREKRLSLKSVSNQMVGVLLDPLHLKARADKAAGQTGEDRDKPSGTS